ncbi:hypothetical protein [Aestuariirhabdus litorea]|uniref:DUF2059 domain-containing protein n=1 Tax=Aestuariirhabdus litorea TaxID=2528527 RepID=A0A3P3VKW9_9GAMM|nr:hypothetical protein [Aestuariirhabdus litorea]RRJ82518.1 hypothetical protein D0544_11645 [Aestuariirhabdus litorea]RWW92679.1 hypothetical protein DZC74_11620 [Endozoicomonadaceae bacterium GTF-13]
MLKTILLVSGLLLSLNSLATNTPRELAEQSVQLSGMELFLQQAPVMLGRLLQAQQTRTDEEKALLKKASDRLQQQLQLDPLRTQLVNALMQGDRPDYLQQMNSALSSPLANAMNEKEKQAGSADGRQRLNEYREKVKLNPPRGVRVELVQRLDKASRTSDISVLLRTELMRSIQQAADLLTQRPAGSREEEGARDQQLHEQLEARTRQQVESFFLYAYRQVPTRQLEQYVQLYEAEPTQWFVEQCIAAIKAFFKTQRATFADTP